MKYLKKFNENTDISDYDKQLEMGIKVESEHGDVYDYIDSYLESFNVPMPFNEKEFYTRIAKAHLREMPDYYTKLSIMESED